MAVSYIYIILDCFLLFRWSYIHRRARTLSTLPTSVNCGVPPCLPCADGLNLIKTVSQNKLFLLDIVVPATQKITNTMVKVYLCVSCLSSLNQIPCSLFLWFTFQYKLEINEHTVPISHVCDAKPRLLEGTGSSKCSPDVNLQRRLICLT